MFIFCFAFGFVFLIVAIRVAPLLDCDGVVKPRIWHVLPVPKSNWSPVKSWVVPSAPINDYLFGWKGWKDSSPVTVGSGVFTWTLIIITL